MKRRRLSRLSLGGGYWNWRRSISEIHGELPRSAPGSVSATAEADVSSRFAFSNVFRQLHAGETLQHRLVGKLEPYAVSDVIGKIAFCDVDDRIVGVAGDDRKSRHR